MAGVPFFVMCTGMQSGISFNCCPVTLRSCRPRRAPTSCADARSPGRASPAGDGCTCPLQGEGCTSIPCSLGPLGRALLENLLDHGLDEIGWDGKIDAICCGVGLAICGTREGDADELPLQTDQSPAAIAGIDSSTCLDGVGNGDTTRFGDAAVEGAH